MHYALCNNMHLNLKHTKESNKRQMQHSIVKMFLAKMYKIKIMSVTHNKQTTIVVVVDMNIRCIHAKLKMIAF